jgi:hypothetical protein
MSNPVSINQTNLDAERIVYVVPNEEKRIADATVFTSVADAITFMGAVTPAAGSEWLIDVIGHGDYTGEGTIAVPDYTHLHAPHCDFANITLGEQSRATVRDVSPSSGFAITSNSGLSTRAWAKARTVSGASLSAGVGNTEAGSTIILDIDKIIPSAIGNGIGGASQDGNFAGYVREIEAPTVGGAATINLITIQAAGSSINMRVDKLGQATGTDTAINAVKVTADGDCDLDIGVIDVDTIGLDLDDGDHFIKVGKLSTSNGAAWDVESAASADIQVGRLVDGGTRSPTATAGHSEPGSGLNSVVLGSV